MEFLLIFIFGLITGSFLNVVVYRLRTRQKIVFGRSFCFECKTQLKWPDLIPVLSFIWLKGRCRYCRKKISWQYPIVEILSGLIWVTVFWKIFGFNFPAFAEASASNQFLNFIYYIFIFSALLIIAVYDYKWQIIPDKIVYPAIAVVLIYNALNAFKLLNLETFVIPFLTAAVAFLFFFLIYYFSKGRAMGLGDAKLAFLIGLFLTPLLAVAAFTLAFIIGAVFGIILLGLGKHTLKSQIAFGPFLILGATIAFFFSNFIMKYLNF